MAEEPVHLFEPLGRGGGTPRVHSVQGSEEVVTVEGIERCSRSHACRQFRSHSDSLVDFSTDQEERKSFSSSVVATTSANRLNSSITCVSCRSMTRPPGLSRTSRFIGLLSVAYVWARCGMNLAE